MQFMDSPSFLNDVAINAPESSSSVADPVSLLVDPEEDNNLQYDVSLRTPSSAAGSSRHYSSSDKKRAEYFEIESLQHKLLVSNSIFFLKLSSLSSFFRAHVILPTVLTSVNSSTKSIRIMTALSICQSCREPSGCCSQTNQPNKSEC